MSRSRWSPCRARGRRAEVEATSETGGVELVRDRRDARLAVAPSTALAAAAIPPANFGDCFAYALAKERREPLLFKGDDFARTDVVPAL